MGQFKQALSRKPETSNISILFIMVNKRIKTKLISEDNGRLSNPAPGTVVDHTITAEGLFDFYLVTTTSRQGLPTPSHFSVLSNEFNATAKDIQSLTFKLCYTYYNYSGPVKIPCPVKLADKMASHLGEINATPHARLSDANMTYFI